MTNKARIDSSIQREFSSHEAAVSALLGMFPKLLVAAENCRVGEKQLSAYANPNLPERQMPIDVVLDLELVAKEPIVTRHLASRQGWAVFPLPKSKSNSKWDRHLRGIVKEASEVFLKLADALEDGKLTHNEAMGLLPEVDEAMSEFASLRHSLADRIISTAPASMNRKITER